MKKISMMFVGMVFGLHTGSALAMQSERNNQQYVEEAAVAVELSSVEMRQIVGAGKVDAVLADYVPGEPVQATVANRASFRSISYSLGVYDSANRLVEQLASGTVNNNDAVVVSATPAIDPTGNVIRIWAGFPSSGAYQALDSQWVYPLP